MRVEEQGYFRERPLWRRRTTGEIVEARASSQSSNAVEVKRFDGVSVMYTLRGFFARFEEPVSDIDLRPVTDRALRFICGLRLTGSDAREAAEVVEALQKALKPGKAMV